MSGARAAAGTLGRAAGTLGRAAFLAPVGMAAFLSLAAWTMALAAAGCTADRGSGPRAEAPGVSPSAARPRPVRVAAAADLQYALEDLAAAFRVRRPDVRLEVTYGSSGNLATQIENGAPFDLFLSADTAYLRRLAEKGLTEPGDGFLYGVGRLVLWVPRGSPLPVQRDGAAVLRSPRLRRLAIANPRHAPYGRAAVAALRTLGLYEQVRPKLVLGENVAQAAAFAAGGAADAAVVALSLALAPAMQAQGRFWEFPLAAYPPLEQGGAVLARARDPEAARAFRSFLLGEKGRAILKRNGFLPPRRAGVPAAGGPRTDGGEEAGLWTGPPSGSPCG